MRARLQGPIFGRGELAARRLPHVLLLLVAAAMASAVAADADDPPRAGVVVLDAQAPADAGIRTALVGASRRPATWRGHARVLDASPLLQARARFEQSRADEAVFQVDMDVARHEYRRLVDLAERGDLVSPQALQVSEGEFQRAQALVRAEQIRQLNIFNELAQSFSVKLADRVLRSGSDFFDALVRRESVLLELTLPPGKRLPEAGDVQVLLPSTGGERVTAAVVSAAAGTDARIQGETWLLAVPGDGLRAGMRLMAVIADPQHDQAGVVVPESAVVWHFGRPWVYLALGDGRYLRRELPPGVEVPEGWFLGGDGPGAIVAGDEVVVTGAMTLLSEEFRWQIPEEDDDDGEDDG
jgi:hypothetical protein